jgi:hypothetical protein
MCKDVGKLHSDRNVAAAEEELSNREAEFFTA